MKITIEWIEFEWTPEDTTNALEIFFKNWRLVEKIQTEKILFNI